MANIYVRSVGGSDANSGATWALAKATLTGALAIATNADTIYLASDHSESTAAAVTLTCPASQGLRILSSNTTTVEPPAGLSTTAAVAVGASAAALSIRGFAYVYGVQFLGATTSGSSSSVVVADTAAPAGLMFENCVFQLRQASTATVIGFGQNGQSANDDVSVNLINPTFKFGNASQSIKLRQGHIRIRNPAIDAAGSTPTTLFGVTAGAPCIALIEAGDLSAVTSTNLVDVAPAVPAVVDFRNLKLPASIAVTTGTIPGVGGTLVRMHNCDSEDRNYRFAEHGFAGSVVNETTIVRTGGATDGTTPLAHKMVSSTGALFPQAPLRGPEMAKWNSTVGTSVTATVEIVHDSQGAGSGSKMQNDEIWLVVQYLGTSGFPRGTVATSAKADVLATAANAPDSTETWTTTGLTTPVKQKLQVTFTPQETGYVLCRVVLAKASKTVYVDPKVSIA